MENLKVGRKYNIHIYKHNGKIYKAWNEAVLLEYDKNVGIYIFGNDHTEVTEADGRVWHTKEPAVLFFFTNHWYNIIGQYKKKGIYYYCNLASPIIIEENTIKYIDYDLDVKVFPGGSFKIVDRGEYKYHKKKMNYPPEVDQIIKEELSDLIAKIRAKSLYFNHETIPKYVEKYEYYKKEISAC